MPPVARVRPWPRRAASLQARGRPCRPQGRSRGDRRRPAGWHCLCRTRRLSAGGGTLFEHIAARGLRNLRHVAAIDCRPRCRHLRVGCRERCAARCGRPGNLRLAFHGARIAHGRSVHRRKLPAVGCAGRFSIPADSRRLSNGVALSIILGQADKIFGFPVTESGILPRLAEIAGKLDAIQWPTLSVAVGTFLVLLIVPRLVPQLPAALVGMVLAGAAVLLLNLPALGVKTIGHVPAGLPSWSCRESTQSCCRPFWQRRQVWPLSASRA